MVVKATKVTFHKFLDFINYIRYGREYGIYHISPDLHLYLENVCKIKVYNRGIEEIQLEYLELPGFLGSYYKQQKENNIKKVKKEYVLKLMSLKNLYFKNFIENQNYPIFFTKGFSNSDFNKRKKFILGKLNNKKPTRKLLLSRNLCKLDLKKIKTHIFNNFINKNIEWYEFPYIDKELFNKTLEPNKIYASLLSAYERFIFSEDFLREKSYNLMYAYNSYVCNTKNKRLLLKKKLFLKEFIKFKQYFNLWYISINSDNIFERDYLNKITILNKTLELSYKGPKFKKLISTKMLNDVFLYMYFFDYINYNNINFIKNNLSYSKKKFLKHQRYLRVYNNISYIIDNKTISLFKDLLMKVFVYDTKSLRNIFYTPIKVLNKFNKKNYNKFYTNRLQNCLNYTYLTPIKVSNKVILKLSHNEKRILLKQIRFYKYNDYLHRLCNSYIYFFLGDFYQSKEELINDSYTQEFSFRNILNLKRILKMKAIENLSFDQKDFYQFIYWISDEYINYASRSIIGSYFSKILSFFYKIFKNIYLYILFFLEYLAFFYTKLIVLLVFLIEKYLKKNAYNLKKDFFNNIKLVYKNFSTMKKQNFNFSLIKTYLFSKPYDFIKIKNNTITINKIFYKATFFEQTEKIYVSNLNNEVFNISKGFYKSIKKKPNIQIFLENTSTKMVLGELSLYKPILLLEFYTNKRDYNELNYTEKFLFSISRTAFYKNVYKYISNTFFLNYIIVNILYIFFKNTVVLTEDGIVFYETTLTKESVFDYHEYLIANNIYSKAKVRFYLFSKILYISLRLDEFIKSIINYIIGKIIIVFFMRNNLDFGLVIKRSLLMIKDFIELILAIIHYYRLIILDILKYLAINFLTWKLFQNIFREFRFTLYVGYHGYLAMPERVLFDWEFPEESSFFGIRTYFDFVIFVGEAIITSYMGRFWIQYDNFMFFMEPTFQFIYRVYIFIKTKIIRKLFILILYLYSTYFIYDLVYRRRLYHDYFLPLYKRVKIDENNKWSCKNSDTEAIEFLKYLQFNHEHHITFKRWFKWIHIDKPLIKLNKYILYFLNLLLYLIRTFLFPEVYGFTLVLLERINKLSYIIVYMTLFLEKLDSIGWFFFEVFNTHLYIKLPFGVVYHWQCYIMEYKGFLKLIFYTPIYISIILTQSLFIFINLTILLLPSVLVFLDVLVEMYYNYIIDLSKISPFAGRKEHFNKYYSPRLGNATRSNIERNAESLIFRVDIKNIINRKLTDVDTTFKLYGSEYYSKKNNIVYEYDQRLGKLREKQFMRINFIQSAFKQEKSYLGTKSRFKLTTYWYAMRGFSSDYLIYNIAAYGNNTNIRYNPQNLQMYGTKFDVAYRALPLELPNRYSRYFIITNKIFKSLYNYIPNYWFDREIDDMLEDSFESTTLDHFDCMEPNEDLYVNLKTKRHFFKYGLYDSMELEEETFWSEYTYKSLHRSMHEFLVIRDNFVDEVDPDRFFEYYKPPKDAFFDPYGNEITIEKFELKYKVPEFLDWRFNNELLTLAYDFYDIYYEEHQYFEDTWYKLKSRINSIYNITDSINKQISHLDLKLDYLKFKKLVDIKDFKLSRDFLNYKKEFYNNLEDQAYVTEREKFVREIETKRREILNKKKSKLELEFINKLESYGIFEDVEFTDQDIDKMNELFLKIENEINLLGLDMYKDYNKLLKVFCDKRRALREQLKENLKIILQELLNLQTDYINKIKPKQVNNFMMTNEQIAKKNYLSLNEERISLIKKFVSILYKNDYNRNMSELATHLNYIKYQLNCLDCDIFTDTLNFKYKDVFRNLRKLKIIKQKNLFRNENQKIKADIIVKKLLKRFNKDKLSLLRKFNYIKKNKSENFFYNNYSLEIDNTNYYHIMYESCVYNGIFTWLFGRINDYAVEDWYNWAFVYLPYLEYDSFMMPDGEYYEHEEDEDDEDEDFDETEDFDDETDGDYINWFEDGCDQDDGVDLEDMLGWLHGEMYDYHIDKGGFKLRFRDKTFYYKETNYNFLIEFIDELKKSAKKLKNNKNLTEHELTFFDRLLYEKQLLDNEGDLRVLKMKETTPEEIKLKQKEKDKLFRLAKRYIYVKRRLIFKQLRKIYKASFKIDDFRRPDKVYIPKGYWDREKDKEKYKEYARNRKLQLDMAYYKGETMLHRLNLLKGRNGTLRYPKGIYFSGIYFNETALLYRLLRNKTLNYVERYSIFPFYLIIEQLDKKYPNDPQRAINEGFKILEDIIQKKLEARKRGEIYKSQTELDLEKPLFGQDEIKEETEYVKNRDEGKYLF